MTSPITMKGLAGVEHLQADARYLAYQPTLSVPTPIRAGDRLRVRLEITDAAWVYAVSVVRGADYERLGTWAPDEHASSGVRVLWPGGRVWAAGEATMTTLVVIGSREELPWLRDLTRASCANLVDTQPADPPITACDHLYGLLWKVPPRPRGLVPLQVELLEDGETRTPAIVAAHSGAPYTAIEWQLRPRP
jgi:hypothetical protein